MCRSQHANAAESVEGYMLVSTSPRLLVEILQCYSLCRPSDSPSRLILTSCAREPYSPAAGSITKISMRTLAGTVGQSGSPKQ